MELPIEQDIVLPVSPDEAWEALLDPAAWLADETDVEFVEGGAGTFVMPDGERRGALVEEVVEGERIALWWWPVDADGVPESPGRRVSFELEPVFEGTRVSVRDRPVGPVALAHA
jgi:Activator of Hsp90 ATPase homolog 1-like protein